MTPPEPASVLPTCPPCAAVTGPARGIVCRACRGVPLKVYRTRRPAAGLVVRYRVCPACGYRCATEERPARDLPRAGGGE